MSSTNSSTITPKSYEISTPTTLANFSFYAPSKEPLESNALTSPTFYTMHFQVNDEVVDLLKRKSIVSQSLDEDFYDTEENDLILNHNMCLKLRSAGPSLKCVNKVTEWGLEYQHYEDVDDIQTCLKQKGFDLEKLFPFMGWAFTRYSFDVDNSEDYTLYVDSVFSMKDRKFYLYGGITTSNFEKVKGILGDIELKPIKSKAMFEIESCHTNLREQLEDKNLLPPNLLSPCGFDSDPFRPLAPVKYRPLDKAFLKEENKVEEIKIK